MPCPQGQLANSWAALGAVLGKCSINICWPSISVVFLQLLLTFLSISLTLLVVTFNRINQLWLATRVR